MKRLLSCLLILSTLSLKAQISETELPKAIKIGEVSKATMNMFVSLSYYTVGTDTTYMLTFANQEYSAITDMQGITFKEVGGTLRSFYQILDKKLSKEDVDGNAIKLGGKDIIVRSTKKYVSCTLLDNGAWFSINKKQLDQLFDKKRCSYEIPGIINF